MNDEKITTLDMFKLLREDIKSAESCILADTRASDERLQNVKERLRKIAEAVAGKKAVSTFQKTLVEWLFRLAAAVGVGGAIKAFFS